MTTFRFTNSRTGSSMIKRACKFCIQRQSISLWGNGLQKSLSKAEKFVDYPSSFLGLQFLLGNETVNFAALAKRLVGTGHPLLTTARDLVADECYSSRTGGLWVLLVSKGTNQIGRLLDEKYGPTSGNGILVKQRKLAGVVETIRVAYLIHRGMLTFDSLEDFGSSDLKALNFGNKLSVLGGDFLLAKACVDLAKLHNVNVVEQISVGLEEIFEGASLDLDEESRQDVGWEEYTLKCNGSLVGASCQAAVTLSGHSEEMQADMREFGKCVGMIQTMFADIKILENGENSKVNETNSVISLARDSNRSVSEALNRSNARDVYQSHVEIVMDVTSRREMLERARTKLGHYCNRARELTNLFSDAETKDVVLDILSNFDRVE